MKGRKIHLLQMLQSQLNYSEVFTDMNFISVSTSPLEERSGCEKKVADVSKQSTADAAYNGILTHKIRSLGNLPNWRQHRDPELLILRGLFESPVSMDKITLFSVRPPELRHIIQKVEQYYRWFHVGNPIKEYEELHRRICHPSELHLVDGLHNVVKIR